MTIEVSAEVGITDGRKRRSSTSRDKIVHAMLRLIKGGDMSPSAARVAEMAGVSLRSVFRHFEDMEQLYHHMTAIVQDRLHPLVTAPLTARGWKAQLLELAERRMAVYDEIMPYKVAGSLRRFQSKFLADDYRRHLKMERATLEAVQVGTWALDLRTGASVEAEDLEALMPWLEWAYQASR